MKLLPVIALGLLVAVGGCNKLRPALPDVAPGWHSGDYSIIMGRLERRANAGEGATWVLRYGLPGDDEYHGEVALMPPAVGPDGKLEADVTTGYAGGEPIEVHGAVDPAFKSAGYGGTWYRVRDILLWVNSENR